MPGSQLGMRHAGNPTGGQGVGVTAPARTDPELIDDCRRGDAVAWDALVSRYQRLVFSVARRNGLGTEDAADVTQVTFIALLDSIDRIRDDERLSFWLMTVARRQAWRAVRQRDRDLRLISEGPASDPIADWERVAVVHDAMAQLGSPCRELVDALYFEAARPSYATIAARLGRAVGSLGPLRARCLQRLRRLLDEDAS